MAITFPASPSTNDIFTEGSITYKYDGAKWIGVGLTPADRLVEGSNKLEIDSNNHLIWTGGDVGLGSSTINQQSGGRTVLSVNGTDNALLNFNHSDTLAGFFYGANDEFRMESNGTRPLIFRGNSETRLTIKSTGEQESFADYTSSATNTFASWARTGNAIRAEVGYNAVTLDYMYFATGTLHPLALRTNNTNALFIDNNQKVLIGDTITSIEPDGYSSSLQVHGDDVSAGISILRYSNDDGGPTLLFGKSKGTTIGTNAVVAADDILGKIEFYGTDTDWESSASIRACADGEWWSGSAGSEDNTDAPGRIEFHTTPNGADNMQERMRITSDGTIQTPYGIQSGGNATGGFKFTSQYSGKGFDIATQYATAANNGSSGADPMFSGWWGADNTLRINTDGQIRARTLELQSPDSDAQFAKYQVLTGAKVCGGDGTWTELFKIGHSAVGRLDVWSMNTKDGFQYGMVCKTFDVQIIYGNWNLWEESAITQGQINGGTVNGPLAVQYQNTGGSTDYLIRANINYGQSGTPGTPWLYWQYSGVSSIRPYNL